MALRVTDFALGLMLARWAAVAVVVAGCAGGGTLDPGPAPEPRVAAAAAVTATAVPRQIEEPVGERGDERCGVLSVQLPELRMETVDPPTVPAVIDADVLAPFFDKVARLLRGEASDHIRIGVYGDSNLTMDYMTGQMRRVLQGKHGDAGHGFVALARPWSHYLHMDVKHGIKGGIASFACSTDPIFDHVYGISGIAGESMVAGSRAWIGTAGEDAPIGHRAGRFAVYFLKGKKRGSFDIEVDGKVHASVDSRASEQALGVKTFDLEDGPHRVVFRATDSKRRVRFLGATMERDVAPSFVVDSFGVGSMNTASQARQHAGINEAMLRHRDYDLIVFATGANDGFGLDINEGHLKNLIALQRRAIPDAAILLMTPADRGKRRSFRPTISVVKQRYTIAKDNGVALWDLWQAMGGEGSMRKFKARGLSKPDYVHFSEAGGAWAGDRFLYALWRELKRYVAEHPTAGCDAQKPAAHAAK